MTYRYVTHVLLFAALLLISAPALADSPLQSTIGGPAAGPATASPAALFWNPAAISHLPGNTLYADLNGSWRLGRYERDLDGADPATQFALDVQPMFAATRQLKDSGLTFGMGVFSPYLDRTRWRGEDGEARWHAMYSGVRTFAITPAMSYKLSSKLSLGVSAQLTRVLAHSYRAVDYGQIVAEQRDRDDIPTEERGNEGRAYLNFKGNAGVLAAGVTWQPSEKTMLGFSFTSGSDVNIQGKYSAYAPRNSYFSNDFGDREDASARLIMNLPQAARLGLEHTLSDSLTLRAGVDYVRWSALDEMRVDVSAEQVAGIQSPDLLVATHWRDVVIARLGFSSQSNATTAWHGLIAYESNPIPEERLNPALLYGHSVDLAIGTTRELRPGHLIDLGYRQRVTLPRSVDESADTRHPAQGDYLNIMGMLQLSYSWSFAPTAPTLPEIIPADSFRSDAQTP